MSTLMGYVRRLLNAVLKLNSYQKVVLGMACLALQRLLRNLLDDRMGDGSGREGAVRMGRPRASSSMYAEDPLAPVRMPMKEVRAFFLKSSSLFRRTSKRGLGNGNGSRRGRSDSSIRGELELWEWYLDQLGFSPGSAVRGHIHTFYGNAGFEEGIQRTFEHLAVDDGEHAKGEGEGEGEGGGRRRIVKCDMALLFSRSIRGRLHILLKRNQSIPLCQVSEEELMWLEHSFESFFQGDGLRGCTRPCWSAFTKLLLVRRVVFSMADGRGLEAVQVRAVCVCTCVYVCVRVCTCVAYAQACVCLYVRVLCVCIVCVCRVHMPAPLLDGFNGVNGRRRPSRFISLPNDILNALSVAYSMHYPSHRLVPLDAALDASCVPAVY